MNRPTRLPYRLVTTTGMLTAWIALASTLGAAPQGPFELASTPWSPTFEDPLAPSFYYRVSASVSALLNADDLPDAAVVAGPEARVLVNPGRWSGQLLLPTQGVVDLDCMEGAAESADGILTAGADGLLLWRWRETASTGPGGGPRGFASVPIGAPWNDVRRVAVSRSIPGFAFVVAYEALPDPQLQLFLVEEGTPTDCTPDVFPFSPIPLPAAPYDLAVVDWADDGAPDVAIADASGLRIVSISNQPLFERTRALDDGLLRSFEPGTLGLPRRLAWGRRDVGDAHWTMKVVDAQAPESAIDFGSHLPTSVTKGRFSPDGDEDLLFGLEDGSAWLLRNGCSMEQPAEVTFTGDEECSFVIPAPVIPPSPSYARPATADFDLDGDDDVLLFHEGRPSTRLHTQASTSSLPSAIVLTSSFGFSLTGGSVLHLNADPAALNARGATHLELLVWPWWHLQPYELASPLAGYQQQPAQQGLQFTIPLVFEPPPGEPLSSPELLGVEIRAVRYDGQVQRVLDTITYAVTKECGVYTELESLLGVDGLQPPDGCEGTAEPPPVGIYIGGVVPVPQLPPFADELVPILPPPE